MAVLAEEEARGRDFTRQAKEEYPNFCQKRMAKIQ